MEQQRQGAWIMPAWSHVTLGDCERIFLEAVGFTKKKATPWQHDFMPVLGGFWWN